MGGLGPLPVLARIALLPETRALLSQAALSAMNSMFYAWLSPRSKVAWAAADDSWLTVDGSENLDATRKGTLYLAALALNKTQPEQKLALDDQPVWAHAAAWESHWSRYLRHRAVEGLGVELGSPTYAQYALQIFVTIADVSLALGPLASDYLQLWFADAAQAFLPDIGVRAGAHTRVYKKGTFFDPLQDCFRGPTWLYGWWNTEPESTES
eukprot:UC1_evm1s390